MDPSWFYAALVVAILVVIVGTSQSDGMWNGPDYYNPALQNVLGGPFPPGMEPPMKAYTMGGLPNSFKQTAPNGAWMGNYDYLGMNLTGRNAFPGDFDFSSYHDRDCGCGCKGRNSAIKDAQMAANTALNGASPTGVPGPAAAPMPSSTSHMVSTGGVGNKYGMYLGSTVATVSGLAQAAQYDNPCQPGTSASNPQACKAPASGSIDYDAGKSISNFTGRSHHVSAGTRVRYTAQTAWPDAKPSFGTNNSSYLLGSKGTTIYYKSNSAGHLPIGTNYDMTTTQTAQAMNSSPAQELNGTGRVNPHIDSMVVGRAHYGKKGTMKMPRGALTFDEGAERSGRASAVGGR